MPKCIKGTIMCIIAKVWVFNIQENITYEDAKCRCPRMNPCGTPAIIISHSLNESPILQRCYVLVK